MTMLAYLVIIVGVSCLTFIAVKFLPRIDKSNGIVSRPGNTDCFLHDAVSVLKIVNGVEGTDGRVKL